MLYKEEDILTDEEREFHIRSINDKLYTANATVILDIADHLHWEHLQFYNRNIEIKIPKKIYERILKECPELLI